MIKEFREARRVSTPLIGITTADPASTMKMIKENSKEDTPMVRWDVTAGFGALNEPGRSALALSMSVLQKKRDPVNVFSASGAASPDPSGITNPAEALDVAKAFPPGTILFFLNAHRLINLERVSQAIWNLRDVYKNRRTLVLLAPVLQLPIELSQDVILLDDPLPGNSEIERILRKQITDVEKQNSTTLPELDSRKISRIHDAVRGLSSFQTEQVIAMSISSQGVDIDQLWNFKRTTIEQTPGLSIYSGKERFPDIGGVGNAKDFLSNVLRGRQEPGSIVFLDELDKSMAGAVGVGDNTGVSQDFLSVFLKEMQDMNAIGGIFFGVAGTAKSALAKAAGNEAEIPTLQFDINAMKTSDLGGSEGNIRRAFKVIRAVSNEKPLFIATCNSLVTLPPELKRRFNLPTFYFDLPLKEERESIWRIYTEKYGLEDQEWPNDTDWTGAEIRTCCDLAWRLNVSLREAGQYIVPIAQSAADVIESMRRQATGRFLSASYKGVYTCPIPEDPMDAGEQRLVYTSAAEV
jgi:hypothetical protein